MKVGKRSYFFLSLLLIFTLLSSVAFPYGNVYAQTSQEGIGMPKLDVNAIPKSPDNFPEMEKEPIELQLK
jgi:hypothetical protein